MYAHRCLALVCLLSLVIASFGQAQERKRECPTCAVRCNMYSTAPTVWAFVDGTCKVFINGCQYSSVFCQRRGSCLSEMVMTTQELCQKSCPARCPTGRHIPVCATYLISGANGEQREEKVTFGSQCALDRSACLNAKPYLSVQMYACESTLL